MLAQQGIRTLCQQIAGHLLPQQFGCTGNARSMAADLTPIGGRTHQSFQA